MTTFTPPNTTKLQIGSLDVPSITVTAQYNPKEVSFVKAVGWTPHKKAGNKTSSDKDDALQLEFTAPAGRTTSVDLLFDAVEENDSNYITQSVSSLEQLASVQVTDPAAQDNQKRPHHCILVWGTASQDAPFVQGGTKFQCVITSITVKYQMFSIDGKPLRATVTLALQEATRVAMAPAGGST